MHTILGAGGVIANELATALTNNNQPLRLVSRHPKPVSGTAESLSADLLDYQQTQDAIAGSSIVYLCAGLQYDIHIWQEQWPKIMQHTIDGCKRAGAKLVFFDNVYMYGRVNGVMTEQTPYNPCSRKGEIRAKIANQLMEETKTGNLTACIARSADFYGPHAGTGVVNLLVFDKLAKGEKAQWLGNDILPHSFTFTPDAGRAVRILGSSSIADNQVWHLPTAANPLTGKEFVQITARAFHVNDRHTNLNKWMIRLGGLFDKRVKELYEMMYQCEYPYLFSSAKFEQTFGYQPVPYEEGIKITAAAYNK